MEHNTRVEQIKTYLERLSTGEELEKIRADFVKEKKLAATAALAKITGHPLQTFTLENEVLESVIRECRKEIAETKTISPELFGKLREVAIHYAKKGDLLYPHLKVKYGISGPSDVMWTTDDEIRDELAELAKRWPFAEKNVGPHGKELTDTEAKWMERFIAALQRVEDMIYKEANIFFPNCALNFTEEEWLGIYHDSKDYPVCFGVENATWEAAETYWKTKNATSVFENEIIMAGGHLTITQLTAMLNTIPMEITFVDADNINRFFNEGPKDFKRPGMAIDREVFSCHPPKVEQQVRHIIEEFRNGNLDKVPIWMEKNNKTMLVTYMAVRNKEGVYLGTMELVQDMGFAKEHFLSGANAL